MDDKCGPQLVMAERANGLDRVGDGIDIIQGFGERSTRSEADVHRALDEKDLSVSP